jgi:hypothetical protein
MAEAIPLAELALRVLVLPPISGGTHFAGPNCGPEQHARRLVQLWQVAESDHVLLAEAFRLLDVNAVTGAISRGMVELERESNSRYWTFPTLEELLPALRELAWQRMLAGDLLVEGIKGIRGKRHRSVLLAELPRLSPKWELSRLTQGGRDEFIEVRVQRTPAELLKKAWREKPSDTDVRSALADVAKSYSPGARPAEKEILGKVRDHRLGSGATREQVRDALKTSPLHGRRGYRGSKT